jgi:hypothetical protein
MLANGLHGFLVCQELKSFLETLRIDQSREGDDEKVRDEIYLMTDT